MSRYRIKDRSGRTIGYAENTTDQFLGGVLGGILAVVLFLIIGPIVLTALGAGWVVVTVWNWGTHLPITPFPNLNGVLIVALAATVLWILGSSVKQGTSEFDKDRFFWSQTIRAKLAAIIIATLCGLVFALLMLIPGIAAFIVFALTVKIVFDYIPGWLFSSEYLLWEFPEYWDSILLLVPSFPGGLGFFGLVTLILYTLKQGEVLPLRQSFQIFFIVVIGPLLGALVLNLTGLDVSLTEDLVLTLVQTGFGGLLAGFLIIFFYRPEYW
jgi:hypothetical protein